MDVKKFQWKTWHEAHTELNKIVHNMIQVTGMILFKAYIIYGLYGSNHVFCKQIQTSSKWLYSAQKYKAIPLSIIWDFNENNNFDHIRIFSYFIAILSCQVLQNYQTNDSIIYTL